jgi:tetratricopeptide (TPR) repeat protein
MNEDSPLQSTQAQSAPSTQRNGSARPPQAQASSRTASSAAGVAVHVVARPDADVEELRRSDKVNALVMASRMALRRGRREEARAQLKQALTLSSTDRDALELLGDICLEEGEQEKAIIAFERGLKYHSQYAAFEEKIALAKLDLAEMETERLLKQQGVTHVLAGGQRKTADRKPGAVAFLSLLLPGAGQFYNEDTERGLVFLVIGVAFFLAWCVPWRMELKMGGFEKVWIGAMFLAWLATHVVAAIDAARETMRENEETKRLLGV